MCIRDRKGSSGGSSNGSGGAGGNSSSGGSSNGSGGASGGSSSSDGGSTLGSGDGSAIASYALKFVGNPYVWGGTSLTKGADCSGFVMSVFANFGYSLPRVAAAQCDASTKKDISQLEPGDLVFYGNGYIDHVALYIGDGKIIHASNAATGIKISDYDYEQPAAVGTFME